MRRAGGDLLTKVGYSGIAQASPLVVNVLLTPYLIRALGLDRFGVWSLFLVLMWTLTSLDGGVSASLARFYAYHAARDDRAGIGRLVLGSAAVFLAIGALVTGACFVLGPAVTLLHIPAALRGEATGVLHGLGPLLTLALLSLSATSLLQACERFRGLAGVTVCSCTAYALGVLLLLRGGRPSSYLLTLTAVVAVRYLVMLGGGLLLGARHLAFRRPLLPPGAERREFGGYALRMQLSGITYFLNGEIDAFVIAALLPIRYVAVYSAGYQAASALRSVPLYAFPPVLTRMTSTYAEGGEPDAVREFHHLQTHWLPGMLAYGAVTTAGVAFAVRAWLGSELLLSGAVAATLLAGYTVQVAFTGMRTCFVRATGRPGLETRYTWLSTAVNTVLTVPLALLCGVLGVVGATALGLVSGSVYFVLLCRRSAGLHEQRVPRRWRLTISLATAVTVAGEIPIVQLDAHGVLPLLLAGVPVVAGLAVTAFRVLPRELVHVPRLGRGGSGGPSAHGPPPDPGVPGPAGPTGRSVTQRP